MENITLRVKPLIINAILTKTLGISLKTISMVLFVLSMSSTFNVYAQQGGSATGGPVTGGSATGPGATGGSATGGPVTGGSAIAGNSTSNSTSVPPKSPF
jgi:uncharacterized membrane protein